MHLLKKFLICMIAFHNSAINSKARNLNSEVLVINFTNYVWFIPTFYICLLISKRERKERDYLVLIIIGYWLGWRDQGQSRGNGKRFWNDPSKHGYHARGMSHLMLLSYLEYIFTVHSLNYIYPR